MCSHNAPESLSALSLPFCILIHVVIGMPAHSLSPKGTADVRLQLFIGCVRVASLLKIASMKPKNLVVVHVAPVRKDFVLLCWLLLTWLVLLVPTALPLLPVCGEIPHLLLPVSLCLPLIVNFSLFVSERPRVFPNCCACRDRPIAKSVTYSCEHRNCDKGKRGLSCRCYSHSNNASVDDELNLCRCFVDVSGANDTSM